MRGAGGPLRILLGPWPLYPVAIMLTIVFSMLIRSLVRVQSQPVGAAPVSGMILPVLAVAAATIAAGLVALWLVPRALERAVPLRGRPTGRARYLLSLLLVCLAMALSLAAVRFGYSDGGPPIQLSPILVTVNTVLVAIIAVFVTNGITGYAVDRLRRQEAVIADQLELVRRERAGLLAAEERARAETARYLHDDMQSTLLRAALRLADLERELPGAQAERLRSAIDEVDRVREDGIRGASRRLAPPLASTGLIVALGELAASYADVMAVEVAVGAGAAERFRIVDEGDRVALAVYRVAEQGLQNALKHGGARAARVEVDCDAEVTVVRVVDDGRGVTPDAVSGTGSAVISAWVDGLGGGWALHPGPDGGAVLEARLGG
ncbi:MAG: sensor histidine kinase [Actinomycetota bacterium]